MNIEIKTSNKPNKKYVAVINNNKKFTSGTADIQTIPCIGTPKEKNRSYQDIQMIILITLYIHRSIQLICCGIKKTLKESINNTNDKYNVNIKLKYNI